MTAEPFVVETQAGCTKEGKPFVITLIDGVPSGQLTPAEAVAMGLRFIQHSIEAERDAGTVLYLRSKGMADKEIAAELGHMRDHREQYDPPEAKA